MVIVYDLIDSMQLRRQEMAIQQSLGMRCPEDEYAGYGYHSYHQGYQDGYQDDYRHHESYHHGYPYWTEICNLSPSQFPLQLLKSHVASYIKESSSTLPALPAFFFQCCSKIK